MTNWALAKHRRLKKVCLLTFYLYENTLTSFYLLLYK
jgi:hypothetical protein